MRLNLRCNRPKYHIIKWWAWTMIGILAVLIHLPVIKPIILASMEIRFIRSSNSLNIKLAIIHKYLQQTRMERVPKRLQTSESLELVMIIPQLSYPQSKNSHNPQMSGAAKPITHFKLKLSKHSLLLINLTTQDRKYFWIIVVSIIIFRYMGKLPR
jgi:hypothetical protein